MFEFALGPAYISYGPLIDADLAQVEALGVNR